MMDGTLGDIRIFPLSAHHAQGKWMRCAGQILPIADYRPLFEVIGTAFGGDGVTNFALPDLLNRVPVGCGSGMRVGDKGGADDHVLTMQEVPSHAHQAMATLNTATTKIAVHNIWASSPGLPYGKTNIRTNPLTVLGKTGLSKPHNNLQPSLNLYFHICVVGLKPVWSDEQGGAE